MLKLIHRHFIYWKLGTNMDKWIYWMRSWSTITTLYFYLGLISITGSRKLWTLFLSYTRHFTEVNSDKCWGKQWTGRGIKCSSISTIRQHAPSSMGTSVEKPLRLQLNFHHTTINSLLGEHHHVWILTLLQHREN